MKSKTLTDGELLRLLESGIQTTIGYTNSKLSSERQTANKYYNGLLPKPLHSGDSKYVSPDVYDSVEMMKAQLLETFGGTQRLLSFRPTGPDDVELARIATEASHHVIFKQNDGKRMINDIVHNGLMARSGILKVFWEEKEETVEEVYEDIDEQEYAGLMAREDYKITQVELDEATGLFTLTGETVYDRSQVRLEVIPPDEFLISDDATDIETAHITAHETSKTVAELIELGVPKKKARELGENAAEDSPMSSQERQERSLDGSVHGGLAGGDERQDNTREVKVAECYMYIDMDNDGDVKLWKVLKAGDYVIDKEQVSNRPFLDFTPLPFPHRFYGSSFVKKVMPTQNAKTMLTRSIINHAMVTNNPRYQVVKGGLINPKELMENRVGGLINVNRPDAVGALPQTGLNPFVFQTIQLLEDNKESTTGISSLSQGLNKDAVSQQNSEGLIENLVSVSQVRQRVIARNFAEQFLAPLYLLVYRLLIENETREAMIEVAGNFVEVTPADWEDREDVSVEFHLGHNDQEHLAQQYVEVDQYLSQDPELSQLYGLEQRRNIISQGLRAKGMVAVDSILMKVEDVEPPGPSPEQQMEMERLELEKRGMALQEAKEQREMFKLQLEAKRSMSDDEFKQMMAIRDAERKDFDSMTRANVAERELVIAESAPDPTTIVSPNS